MLVKLQIGVSATAFGALLPLDSIFLHDSFLAVHYRLGANILTDSRLLLVCAVFAIDLVIAPSLCDLARLIIQPDSISFFPLTRLLACLQDGGNGHLSTG